MELSTIIGCPSSAFKGAICEISRFLSLIPNLSKTDTLEGSDRPVLHSTATVFDDLGNPEHHYCTQHQMCHQINPECTTLCIILMQCIG